MKNKLIYTVFLAAALSACTEDTMDSINKDEANPPAQSVNAKFQITDATMATAFSGWGGAYAWYVSSFTEQTFGTGNNQLMKAELRMRGETAASTTYNNEWNSIYSNLNNIGQIIDKCADGGLNAGQSDLLGMAQVLWVLNAELLTDVHGDIPYSEALKTDQPKLDKQEDIYADLLVRIGDAISLLDAAAAEGMNNAGAQDILYGGDPSRWLGLAHAVKARLLLNTSFRDNGAYAKALAAGEAALTAGFDGAQLTVFNGVDCDNPWAAYNWSRYYTGANGTVVDLMTSRNDPRLDVYAWDAFGTGYAYAPAGDSELAKSTNTVGLPVWLENGAAPLHLFSLAELHFIIAECKARTGADASGNLAAAVQASFDDYAAATEEALGDASAYVAALGAPTLAEVMVQKYLAQTRDEQVQTYNDLRRCKAQGEEFVKLLNPNNSQGGQNQWPLRLPYGNSDVVSNPNVTAAFGTGNDAGNYIFTENVWLFGGSR
ncbi:MAG: SusD/RagB family nutrient-binding outer membrane lipoprotein [Muribaculaceae bacterium]|nr:SusD/RagB family nutrient-binding outer membrane lipoprotein [Muribaculaceae bacterium]